MLKFFIYFSISFLILTVSVQNELLFKKIYRISAPYQKVIASNIKKVFHIPRDLSSISPKSLEIKSLNKKLKNNIDHYTDEEKTFLKETISKYTK